MLLLLSLLISVANAPAQDVPRLSAATYEGQVVGRIDFDPPDQPIPRAALEKLLPFHPGDRLKLADVHTAIQNLYQTGRFDNISISAVYEGATLVMNISTEFSYFVGQVTMAQINEIAKVKMK